MKESKNKWWRKYEREKDIKRAKRINKQRKPKEKKYQWKEKAEEGKNEDKRKKRNIN
jgi:hypothetical protein